MAYVLGIMKAPDFEKFKASFEHPESITWRKESGGSEGRLFRVAGEPDKVVVLIEWDTVENARRHGESPKLQEIHQELGVTEMEGCYLEEV